MKMVNHPNRKKRKEWNDKKLILADQFLFLSLKERREVLKSATVSIDKPKVSSLLVERNAADQAAYDDAYRARLEEAGYQKKDVKISEWFEVDGQDPWLTADYWGKKNLAEKARIERAERKARSDAEKLKAEHAAKERALRDPPKEEKARIRESIISQGKNTVRAQKANGTRDANEAIKLLKLDEMHKDNFERALWCYRNREAMTKDEKTFIERKVCKKAHSNNGESPLRAYRQQVNETARMEVNALFEKYNGITK